jgi:hypothetical protein
MLDNLFPVRSNTSRENKLLKSTQLVARSDKSPLESLRNFTDIHSMKGVGSQRFQFGTLAEIKEELGGADLYPLNNNLLTCFNCPIEERS